MVDASTAATALAAAVALKNANAGAPPHPPLVVDASMADVQAHVPDLSPALLALPGVGNFGSPIKSPQDLGGLPGCLGSFSWTSPTDLAAKFPNGNIPIPVGAAVVVVEPGHGGTGYTLGWGGGGGSYTNVAMIEGDSFPCGQAAADQAVLVIGSPAGASGSCFLTVWELKSGMLRATGAKAQAAAASADLLATGTIVSNVATVLGPFGGLGYKGARFTANVNGTSAGAGQVTATLTEIDGAGNTIFVYPTADTTATIGAGAFTNVPILLSTYPGAVERTAGSSTGASRILGDKIGTLFKVTFTPVNVNPISAYYELWGIRA